MDNTITTGFKNAILNDDLDSELSDRRTIIALLRMCHAVMVETDCTIYDQCRVLDRLMMQLQLKAPEALIKDVKELIAFRNRKSILLRRAEDTGKRSAELIGATVMQLNENLERILRAEASRQLNDLEAKEKNANKQS